MSQDQNNPPEVIGETPAKDPNVVGTLNEGENAALAMLRRQGQQFQMQIGDLEIRKARLLGNMSELEAQGQKILTEAGLRLGIKEGTAWNVAPDGTIRLIPGGPGPQG